MGWRTRRAERPQVLLAGALLLMAACSGTSPSDLETQCAYAVAGDYYIGGLLPLTGTWPVGDGFERAAVLAVDEINAAGGLPQGKLGFIACDTAGRPEIGVQRLELLLSERKLGGVLGPGRSVVMLGDGLSDGVATRVSQTHTPLISPSATAPAISGLDDDGYVFRTAVSDAAQGRVLSAIAEREGYQRVLIAQLADPWAIGLRDAFGDSFLAGDAAREVSLEIFTPLEAYAQRVLEGADLVGADAVLIAGFFNEALPLLEHALDYPWQRGTPPAFLLADGAAHPLIEAPAQSLLTKGGSVFGTMPGTPSGTAHGVFDGAYRTRYDVAPAPYDAGTYDAVYLLASAMARVADPTDGPAVRSALSLVPPPDSSPAPGPGEWAEIRAAIDGNEPFNYRGASGEVDFDSDGDVQANVNEWAIQNGVITVVQCWTPDATYCEPR